MTAHLFKPQDAYVLAIDVGKAVNLRIPIQTAHGFRRKVPTDSMGN